jgi:hypothetical protein
MSPARIRLVTTAHSSRSARAADPLEPARDGLRGLHLDHQVDGTHVDPQLERGGRHQAGQLPGLQELLDHQALLVRERAVMGPGHLDRSIGLRARAVARVLGGGELLLGVLVRQLVQAFGQPLGAPAVVDEDDRRGVLADELEQLRVDRRPDRAGGGRSVEVVGRREAGVPAVAALLDRRVGVGHVLDRHDDLQVELLALAGVGDLALSPRPHEEVRDPLEWPLRRR